MRTLGSIGYLLLVATLAALGLSTGTGAASAAEIHVAAASNFIEPMKEIKLDFERSTSHRLIVSFGSTGKFYAQIRSGAPFDVLLAADTETPLRLEEEGHAVPGSRFTYALGKLVLWSPKPSYVDDRGDVLQKAGFRHLAVANPKLAPYGRAAIETLTRLRLLDRLQPALVFGEDIAQTFQFVSTGNADLGFVALSQVLVDGRIAGSAWIVPSDFHQPIRQDAALLEKGRGNPVADAFLSYLKSEKARASIKLHGYDLP